MYCTLSNTDLSRIFMYFLTSESITQRINEEKDELVDSDDDIIHLNKDINHRKRLKSTKDIQSTNEGKESMKSKQPSSNEKVSSSKSSSSPLFSPPPKAISKRTVVAKTSSSSSIMVENDPLSLLPVLNVNKSPISKNSSKTVRESFLFSSQTPLKLIWAV